MTDAPRPDSNNHEALKRLFTASEIAELLCVTPKWVYSACRLYDMPYYQIGRYKRFSLPEVLHWADSFSYTKRSSVGKEA